MTGANEAELMNELRTPFAMFGLIDNMANGLGEKLTVRSAQDIFVNVFSTADLRYILCLASHACSWKPLRSRRS